MTAPNTPTPPVPAPGRREAMGGRMLVLPWSTRPADPRYPYRDQEVVDADGRVVARVPDAWAAARIVGVTEGAVKLAASLEGLRTLRDDRQAIVSTWAAAAFGVLNASDPQERALRLLEEAIEAAQAVGVPEDAAARLAARVYAKPAGEIGQELGGIGVTVLALAAACGVSAEDAERAEVARVLSKSLDHFRARHDAKAAEGIAMPCTHVSEASA